MIFSILGRLKYKDHVEKYLSSLPDQFSYEELEKIARKEGEENTTNNDLGMENHFYNTQIKKDLKKWEGYQKNYNFLQSREYNDLQLVLDQFAKSKVNVIFVFQPVNKKWMDFTLIFSCRKITANINVITTLNLSIGTTLDASPACNAL